MEQKTGSVVPQQSQRPRDPEPVRQAAAPPRLRSLKTGYGFVNYPPNNLFFHYTSLIDTDFNELQVDDEIEFTMGQNAEGKDIAIDVRLLRP